MILSRLCQVKKKYCRSAYQRVDASTSIWVVEGNEIIAPKLVVTMDTHLHMNRDPMNGVQWVTTKLLLTKVHQIVWLNFMSHSYVEVYYNL